MPNLTRLAFILLIPLNIIWSSQSHSTEQPIRYFQTDQRYNYALELLTLLLDATAEEYGPYKLQPISETDYQRGTTLISRSDRVDILISGPNKMLMEHLNPVLTPIEQGLLGYRIFFIHKDNAPAFSKLDNLEELTQQFTAGFGADWVDRKILEHNRIPLVPHKDYKALYKMLIGKRFDYFPRGASEILPEYDKYKQIYPELAIENTLAIYYPYPRYFFVNRKNTVLKERLDKGFDIITKDDRFQNHFEKHHKRTLDFIRSQNRKVFVLSNPLLPANIPLPDTSSWLPDTM